MCSLISLRTPRLPNSYLLFGELSALRARTRASKASLRPPPTSSTHCSCSGTDLGGFLRGSIKSYYRTYSTYSEDRHDQCRPRCLHCLPFTWQFYTHSQVVNWTCWRELYGSVQNLSNLSKFHPSLRHPSYPPRPPPPPPHTHTLQPRIRPCYFCRPLQCGSFVGVILC